MGVSLEQVTAVVLAGGFGTRIRHVLPDLPKPMAPTAGRPFVEWVVRFLANQGVRKMALSTGYLAEVIERHFQRTEVKGTTLQCFPEKTALGTAGGFLNAAEACRGAAAWLVLNGDSLVLANLAPLADALEPAIDGALLGLRVADASRYGTLETDANGNLERFAEKKPGRAVVNAGVYLLRDELLGMFPQHRPLSFETEVFPALLEAGRKIRVVTVEAPFLDIGTEDSLKEAEGFILKNQEHFYIEQASGARE